MDESLILNFGDSQAEVYDYVFYNNNNYKKFIDNNSPGWRSGWSLRGLNKPEYSNILFNPIYDLSDNIKNVFIFLTFENIDFFIIITFPFIPLPLSLDYMYNFSQKNNTLYYEVLSHHERFYLWYNYCNKLIDLINTYNFKKLYLIDLRNDFLRKGFAHFTNKNIEDHHPNYIITKEYIIKYLNNLTFYNNDNKIIKLKIKSWQYNYLYPHLRRVLQ
jgi:hypothetical protein